MADDSSQDRTEQPTARRLEEARNKGQVARSRELGGAAVVVAGAVALWLTGGWIERHMEELLRIGLAQDPRAAGNPAALLAGLRKAVSEGLLIASPILGGCAIAAIFAPLAVGGIAFSMEPAFPKAERLDPIKGIGRLFSARSAMELAKTLCKFVLVAGVAAGALWMWRAELFELGRMPLLPALASASHIGIAIFILMATSLGAIAAVDVPFQLWEHRRQLRMTREEIREELKQSEGRPEVKSRIRAAQQAMAGRRMFEAIPGADVVVTNPTHYAVALRYVQEQDAAPVVVAKGVDHMAQRIREVARRHRVPILEAPPLARVLYRHAEVDQLIPRNLYVAVAQVLGWVYQLKAARSSGVPPPPRPDVEVDESD